MVYRVEKKNIFLHLLMRLQGALNQSVMVNVYWKGEEYG